MSKILPLLAADMQTGNPKLWQTVLGIAEGDDRSNLREDVPKLLLTGTK